MEMEVLKTKRAARLSFEAVHPTILLKKPLKSAPSQPKSIVSPKTKQGTKKKQKELSSAGKKKKKNLKAPRPFLLRIGVEFGGELGLASARGFGLGKASVVGGGRVDVGNHHIFRELGGFVHLEVVEVLDVE